VTHTSSKNIAPRLSQAAAAIALTSAALSAAYTYILDCWAGVTADLAFNALVVAIAILIGALPFAISRRRRYFLVPLVIAIELFLLNAIDFSPVKPAKRVVAAIQPGMTESQVRSIVDAEFPLGGRFQRPGIGSIRNDGTLSFVLDHNDERYDAAIVEVTFRGGRVTRSRFMPD